MIRLRPILLVLLVALVGALGTLVAGAIVGMHAGDLVHLSALLAPAILATVAAAAAAKPLLSRATFSQRMISIAVVAAVVGMANLAVLSRTMFVSKHDATVIAILLLYSACAGVGAAIVISRSSSAALHKLTTGVENLGAGDPGARIGTLESAGPELDALAVTFDEMAGQLQRAAEHERQIEGTRRDLITAVSHDLRAPLANLRAMTEAIDDGVVDDPPTFRRYAGEMRRSVDALVAMVDDLFELAQIDAGAILAETERVRLEDAVISALASCEGEAARKSVVLETNLQEPDALCSPRLVRVLQNLVTNAIRHTPADGTVRIESALSPSGLDVAVEDTGEGISTADLDRVFEPFWRADESRSRAAVDGGSGLGLALAQRIVQALGGNIRATERSQGARFELHVPAAS